MASPITDSRTMSSASAFIPPRHDGSRTQSFSSDRPSVSTLNHSLLTPPLSVTPEAAFITETAASQIITNNHETHASAWCDQNGIEPSGDPASLSPAALKLVNAFLDQLLFNFLQVAKSTSLAALRPAVSEILKPKLARDTIHNADEELREYLGDADEDDYLQPSNDRDWDLELAWKRARLRCMVYSSLGDLEEEDEDMYMQQENLEVGANENASDVISAAVAIFLTSVIEYMGEMTLTVSGQIAYQRIHSKMEKQIKEGTRKPNDRADRLVIDEMDMERVAFDRTLGRLWRAWKKRLRGPAADSLNRPFSASSADMAELHGLVSSSDMSDKRRFSGQMEETIAQDVQPADIPLPMGDNDVAEIEVPGLAPQSDEDDNEDDDEESLDRSRPKSLMALPTYDIGMRVALLAGPHPAIVNLRRRSYSMPATEPSASFSNATRSKKNFKAGLGTGVRSASQMTSAAMAKSRLRKLATGTGGKTRHGDGAKSELDDALEHAIYEKAEIVKSSRVSVASISSRSVSESGGATNGRRPSSEHSARIIDVPAPRSPAHSHRLSLDAPDRRPASLYNSTPRSQSSTAEESRRSKNLDNVTRAGSAAAAAAVARSSVDKVRPSLQNASTISESEEEIDDRPTKSHTGHAASSTRHKDPISRLPYGLQTNVRQTDRKMSSPKIDQSTSSNKVTMLNKGDGKGMSAAERTKSKEVEEEVTALHSSVPPRPIHTSGSSGSSGTGRPKALRSSEESSSRAESVARNFEELIHSNQTISYTLTPEYMRDMRFKSSVEASVVSKVNRKSEELRSPTTTEGTISPLARRAATGISPVSIDSDFGKPSGPVPRAPSSATASSVRTGGPQARDARVPGESMADFAEFIKSTGPSNDMGPAALRNIYVPASPMRKDDMSRRVSTASSRSNNSLNRSRYQPREPVIDHHHTDTSDLVDFLRQGPPSAMAGQHRIPRHVAPFRTTMDSDQFNGVAGGKAIDAMIPEIRYSQTSASLTENSMPSMQSVNSSSALLRNGSSSGVSKIFGDEDGMPVRKTRRVRDPYAIDFSDEDDFDDFESSPVVPPKREESLAEFLRNYEPPPQPESQPMEKVLKKKTSSPSLIGRFGRAGSKDNGSSAGQSSKEARPSNSRTSNAGFSGSNEPQPRSSRTGSSKHIPLVVNMPPGYDMYGPIAGYSESGDAAPAPRVPMKKFEQREAADRANVMRDSLPSPSHDRPPTSSPSDEGSGFSKMLGRRKKATLA